jgi:hypothetical protein
MSVALADVAIGVILFVLVFVVEKGNGEGIVFPYTQMLIFFKTGNDCLAPDAAFSQVKPGADFLKDRHENSQSYDAAESATENQIAAGTDKNPKQKHHKARKEKNQ